MVYLITANKDVSFSHEGYDMVKKGTIGVWDNKRHTLAFRAKDVINGVRLLCCPYVYDDAIFEEEEYKNAFDTEEMWED